MRADERAKLNVMDELDDDVLRRRNAARICYVGGTCGLLSFGFYYLHLVPFTAPLITVIALTSVYFVLPVLLKTKLPLTIFSLICFLWMEVVLFATAFNFGGFTSPIWPWFGAVPVLTYYFLRGRDRFIVFAALGVGLIGIAYLDFRGHVFTSTIPEDQYPMVYMGSVTFAIIFIGAITRVFTTLIMRSHRNLKKAKNDAIEKQRDAELANAAKTQFLANISHELRTPLNAIIGFSDLIQGEVLGPIGNAKYAEYNKDINGSATHLLSIIDDVLDYSRLEAGKVKLFSSLLDVEEVVQEVLKQVKFGPTVTGLIISEEYAENLPALSADERLVKQVLINLIVNAVKFTGQAGRITIAAHIDSNDCFRVIVKDTGVGIAKEDLEHVTEPFFKAKLNSLITAEGTGLGLAIAQEFMNLHGGRLTIQSKVNSGTEVTCTFPPWRTFKPDAQSDSEFDVDNEVKNFSAVA